MKNLQPGYIVELGMHLKGPVNPWDGCHTYRFACTVKMQ